MTQLTPQEVEMIEREAKERFIPAGGVLTPRERILQTQLSKLYVQTVIQERERSKKLMEALEEISKLKLNSGIKLDWKDAAEAIDIANTAITEYKNNNQ